jgi:hypothetical protein
VRCVLALIFCGNRIYEVTTATLGPLPLDQLPKSKPVTPYAVFLILPGNFGTANRQPPPGYLHVNSGPATMIPAIASLAAAKRPLRALAVAEDAPAGA